MSAETEDVRGPLLPLIGTSRDLVEMAETAETTETEIETEMIGVVSPHRRQISTATCLDRTVDHPALPSILCKIQPSFLTKLVSPISANGGE